MTLSFLPIGPESSELMARMHQLCFQGQTEQIWSEKTFNDLFTMGGMSGFMVRDKSQTPIGFCVIRIVADEAEIITMCVLPDDQGHGIGLKLLAHYGEFLASSGVRQLFLEVREDNHPAIGLYKKAGFTIKGQRKNYYGNRPQEKAHALIMGCDIDGKSN